MDEFEQLAEEMVRRAGAIHVPAAVYVEGLLTIIGILQEELAAARECVEMEEEADAWVEEEPT